MQVHCLKFVIYSNLLIIYSSLGSKDGKNLVLPTLSQTVSLIIFLLFFQIDVFKVEAADLGKIYRVKIWHDNKNLDPSWNLDYVEVIDVADGNKSYMFHCERWLSKSKDDCKIERSLYVKVRSNIVRVHCMENHEWM